ncbi:hypothetical protein IWX90DRAFT_436634 [Phyllosticta citrichinensis]|uniref:Secreted protein n=1 Tax=Phyllosticta citrichinensis TaxID=1130410 RepID=A0ABR1XRN1_9PEZI
MSRDRLLLGCVVLVVGSDVCLSTIRCHGTPTQSDADIPPVDVIHSTTADQEYENEEEEKAIAPDGVQCRDGKHEVLKESPAARDG